MPSKSTTKKTKTESAGALSVSETLLEVAGPKPGLKSSELWLTLTTAAAISQVALSEFSTWPAALCCLGLAIVVGSYSVSRALAKRPSA